MTQTKSTDSGTKSGSGGRKPRVLAPKLGVLGTLRWLWRQLTSMRTALFLLLILAVAAVPGSIFPQRSIDAGRVTTYLDEHQTIGPWLDKLSMFDVYGAPWFAAIYILLLISLVGCVLPRCVVHAKALRSPLPRVPKRLSRLPASSERTVDASTGDLVEAARETLRRKGYRVRVDDAVDGEQAVTAEGGRLRETGNLLFHLCLLILVLAVAADHLMGWRGDVIVPEGNDTFVSAVGSYNTLDLGPWVNTDDIKPWTLKVNKLDVTFEKNVPKDSPQFGQPRDFIASVTTGSAPGSKTTTRRLAVNDAVKLDGTSVYLLGNGYAPVITVKDPKGKVLYHQATPFLPQDNAYRSVGAVKVPAASPKELGFFGFFLPTATFDDKMGPISTYAGLDNPALVLGAYRGDLFPDGTPQSVYTLNTKKMTQVKDGKSPWRAVVKPGQTVKLPDGTTISMDKKIPRWAGLSARYDPGKGTALGSALLGLAGLIMSMTLRRRRIFFKVRAAGRGEEDDKDFDTNETGPAGGRSLITAGALAKGEDPRLQVALDALLDGIETRLGNTPTSQAGSAR
ncbi:cytochrome c biogenesis protein ResB [Flexivirga endophytica]|uniref:Cytochrome c biogenesis protein ResB n=1 Tax=Flexivirga endophytica TaxID=1849103 RepID=A0A916WYN7_9MICO|nr:cytochrome c biogenesis protein ResB [Flexivirga endophytica]GGB42739.1 cytochrome c biogenesis protein ResB [Flexivirga endophytica]GHB64232.1 cytochrome c biogenesis protein ResB [Flexivirga endophytica]